MLYVGQPMAVKSFWMSPPDLVFHHRDSFNVHMHMIKFFPLSFTACRKCIPGVRMNLDGWMNNIIWCSNKCCLCTSGHVEKHQYYRLFELPLGKNSIVACIYHGTISGLTISSTSP